MNTDLKAGLAGMLQWKSLIHFFFPNNYLGETFAVFRYTDKENPILRKTFNNGLYYLMAVYIV